MKKLLLGAFFLFLFAWFIMGLAGCTTQRKAVRYFNKHGFEAAGYCAQAFPITDSVTHSTTVKYDTITTPGGMVIVKDTTICPASNAVTKIITQKVADCPDVQVVTRTVSDTVTVYRENKKLY